MLAALAAAWSLNLYNFMDGSDGLAALMTVIGFAAYGVVLPAATGWTPDAAAVALAAATLPFLVVNLPAGADIPRRRRARSRSGFWQPRSASAA